MRAVRDTVPTDIPDKRQHCLAAGGIALACSVAEAYIAGVGKEVSDAFTGGDPDWQDLRADAFGIRCAKAAKTEAGLLACCAPLGTKMP
ncbi:MAG TPA: hypothetical protein VJQ47_16740 [Steroidobacteraceae bacterium]|nr:hypothetical protein [Steroidobacteraceae bacterium]